MFTQHLKKRKLRAFFLILSIVGFVKVSEAQRWNFPNGVSISGGATYCQNNPASDIEASISGTSTCNNGANQTVDWTISIIRNSDNTSVATCTGSPNSCTYTPPTSSCGDEIYYAEVSWSTTGCAAGNTLTSSTVTVSVDCDTGCGSGSGGSCVCSTCIVVNEFAVDPGSGENGNSSSTGEFVELYNTCDETVDIGCYVICLTDDTSGGRGECSTIPAGTSLAAGDVYVLGGYGTNCSGGETDCDWNGASLDFNWHADASQLWDVDADGFFSSNSGEYIGVLQDSGEEISLFDCSGAFLDGVKYDGGSGTYSTTENIGSVNGCDAKSITIDSGNNPNLGSSPGSSGADEGWQRQCDGSWSFAAFADQTLGSDEGCATVACPTPTALSDLYVDAKNEGDKNTIVWQYLNTDALSFRVEKSSDGETFTSISHINFNISTQNYFYDDVNPLNETYYRITVLDIHNNVFSSEKIIVYNTLNKAFTVENIYPNPTKDKFSFSLSTNKRNKSVHVYVYNLLGDIVYENSLKEGLNHSISVSDLEIGIYTLLFTDGIHAENQRLVVK